MELTGIGRPSARAPSVREARAGLETVSLATSVGGGTSDARSRPVSLRRRPRPGPSLVLRSEAAPRRSSSAATPLACQLDESTIPRRGAISDDLASATRRCPCRRSGDPSHDELHLRDGSVRAESPREPRRATRDRTPERTHERRARSSWIYLAPRPAGVSVWGAGRGGGAWWQRGRDLRVLDGARWAGAACFAIPTPAAVTPLSPGPFKRFTRSGCVRARAPETWVLTLTKPPSGSASGRWYRAQPAAVTGLRARGRVSIDGGISDGLLVLGAPSRPSSYRVQYRDGRRSVSFDHHWSSAASTHQQELLHGDLGGRGSGSGATRVLDALRTHDEGRDARLRMTTGAAIASRSPSREADAGFEPPATRSSAPVAADRGRAAGRRRAMTETARVAVSSAAASWARASSITWRAPDGPTSVLHRAAASSRSGSTWHAGRQYAALQHEPEPVADPSRQHGSLYRAARGRRPGEAVGFTGREPPARVRCRTGWTSTSATGARRGRSALPFEVIGPDEIRRLHPLVETRGLLGSGLEPGGRPRRPDERDAGARQGRARPGRAASAGTRASPALERTPGGSGASSRTEGDFSRRPW